MYQYRMELYHIPPNYFILKGENITKYVLVIIYFEIVGRDQN